MIYKNLKNDVNLVELTGSNLSKMKKEIETSPITFKEQSIQGPVVILMVDANVVQHNFINSDPSADLIDPYSSLLYIPESDVLHVYTPDKIFQTDTPTYLKTTDQSGHIRNWLVENETSLLESKQSLFIENNPVQKDVIEELIKLTPEFLIRNHIPPNTTTYTVSVG